LPQLVNARTGELDLRSQFKPWSAKKHYAVLVLAFLKRIFYDARLWCSQVQTENTALQSKFSAAVAAADDDAVAVAAATTAAVAAAGGDTGINSSGGGAALALIAFNEDALHTWESDPEAFSRRCQQSADASLSRAKSAHGRYGKQLDTDRFGGAPAALRFLRAGDGAATPAARAEVLRRILRKSDGNGRAGVRRTRGDSVIAQLTKAKAKKGIAESGGVSGDGNGEGDAPRSLAAWFSDGVDAIGR
jgi:hypothetical protein